MTTLTEAEIREALGNQGIEVTFKYDYTPSRRPDKAVYEEIEFCERAWRAVLLVATNRLKSSRRLNETQNELKRKTRLDRGGLRVRVLTLNAALRLQAAGYELECVAQSTPGEPKGDRFT